MSTLSRTNELWTESRLDCSPAILTLNKLLKLCISVFHLKKQDNNPLLPVTVTKGKVNYSEEASTHTYRIAIVLIFSFTMTFSYSKAITTTVSLEDIISNYS